MIRELLPEIQYLSKLHSFVFTLEIFFSNFFQIGIITLSLPKNKA